MTRSFEAALPATTFTVSLRARRFAFFPGPCEVVFSFPKQSHPSGWSLRARLSVCEAISTTRLLRAFGPRNDWGKVTARSLFRPFSLSLRASFVRLAKQSHFSPFRWSLRGRLFASEAISFFCLLVGHCEVVVSPPKQSQRFLAALRLGMTEEGVIANLVFSSGEAISPSLGK